MKKGLKVYPGKREVWILDIISSYSLLKNRKLAWPKSITNFEDSINLDYLNRIVKIFHNHVKN